MIKDVLAVQKVLSGSGRAGRLHLMWKYIGHRLVARPELDNTLWTDSNLFFIGHTEETYMCLHHFSR